MGIPARESTSKNARHTEVVVDISLTLIRLLTFAGLTGFCTTALAIDVDVSNREETRQFYWNYFEETTQTDIEWTGDHFDCEAGTTSPEYQDSVAQQINFFRAMAGVPAEVTLSDEFNAKAQEAALLMSKNNRLNHFPPSGWSCYTEDASQAARSSNLLLGTHGPSAITRYMLDPGADNYFVGHRRWILHPQTEEMGTGDVPRNGFLASANALWVLDGRMRNPRPETRDPFIAWPPAGFVPNRIVYPRWSFGMPGADFSQADVDVTLDGSSLSLSVEPVRNGFSDPTIVWQLSQPLGGYASLAEDLLVTVSIDGVLVNGTRQSFEYDVTIFDPNIELFTASEVVIPGIIEEPVIAEQPPVDLLPVDPPLDLLPNDQLAEVCPGSDFNGDGMTTFQDFLILSTNFGSTDVETMHYSTRGDVDCNGAVNFDDFLLFARNYNVLPSADTEFVPEPTTAELCWVLLVAVPTWRAARAGIRS